MAFSVEREPRVTNNQAKMCIVSADESEKSWTRKCEHCPAGWIHLRQGCDLSAIRGEGQPGPVVWGEGQPGPGVRGEGQPGPAVRGEDQPGPGVRGEGQPRYIYVYFSVITQGLIQKKNIFLSRDLS